MSSTVVVNKRNTKNGSMLSIESIQQNKEASDRNGPGDQCTQVPPELTGSGPLSEGSAKLQRSRGLMRPRARGRPGRQQN